jgi:hypothetical protein
MLPPVSQYHPGWQILVLRPTMAHLQTHITGTALGANNFSALCIMSSDRCMQ